MEVSYSIDIDTIDDNDSELLVFFRYEKIVFNRIKKKRKRKNTICIFLIVYIDIQKNYPYFSDLRVILMNWLRHFILLKVRKKIKDTDIIAIYNRKNNGNIWYYKLFS